MLLALSSKLSLHEKVMAVAVNIPHAIVDTPNVSYLLAMCHALALERRLPLVRLDYCVLEKYSIMALLIHNIQTATWSWLLALAPWPSKLGRRLYHASAKYGTVEHSKLYSL